MNENIILPNYLRWFLVQNLKSFTPWHIDGKGMKGASDAFHNEDLKKRNVFVFATRQDNDDFAGLEIIEGVITDRVIYFHPSFGNNVPGWDIVCGEYEDTFTFIASVVIPDMKDWALTEDADEI